MKKTLTYKDNVIGRMKISFHQLGLPIIGGVDNEKMASFESRVSLSDFSCEVGVVHLKKAGMVEIFVLQLISIPAEKMPVFFENF